MDEKLYSESPEDEQALLEAEAEPCFPDARNHCGKEIGDDMATEGPLKDWIEGISKLAQSEVVKGLVKNLKTENGRVFLEVADVQRSFGANAKFQEGFFNSLSGKNLENGMKFILSHLNRVGRYTESEHGSEEDFRKSQQAIVDYLNPAPPVAEPAVAVAQPTPAPEPSAPAILAEAAPKPAEAQPGKLEIPDEFATTGLAEVIRETGFDGKVIIERLAGNGNRPVAILVPKNFNPEKPAKVLVHFHGTHSEEIAQRNFRANTYNRKVSKSRFTQVTQQLMAAKDENLVVAYPISAGPRGGASDTKWMSKKVGEDFDQLVKGVENLAGLRSSTELFVSGHSAGGKPMANLAESVSGRKVSKFIFLDASYGVDEKGTRSNWAGKLVDAMNKGLIPKAEVQLFLQKNLYPKSAYVHTLPIESELKSKGVTINTDKTKHEVMIETHLLGAIKTSENPAKVVAS